MRPLYSLKNPTLAIGSMLLLEIDDIKKDYNDLTLSISNNLLDVLAADYDGKSCSLF